MGKKRVNGGTFRSTKRKAEEQEVASTQSVATGAVLTLPGGYAHTAVNDEASDVIAFRVRAYLDELFGTIMLQVKESNHCFDAIPVVVKAVLNYNNIQFTTIDLYKTGVHIPEPLWFKFELEKKRLILYLNESMYNEYCTATATPDVPVVWSSGHVMVDKYNPYCAQPEVSEVDDAKIKCAVVCDHVAQHIIHRYYNETPLTANTELHEGGWTRFGTTLHSMLNIEVVEIPCRDQHGSTGSQVLTMVPQSGSRLGMISSREYAF